ncbi:bifunctional phosphoribosylaminoimidazolecarboxamide formyltransferase/IMP cyclohydrolase [Candidatus Peregrinibacteria bacterium]|nr:bifunctional phosphoribosylaminoimidazolecarboxamide formyltransferase/IMP cyclohydrolase [Candidatus Peregrinibacteria bacterium]
MKYALVSVSDATGFIPVARGLTKAGYTIIATTGTGKILRKNRILFTPVETFTGTPALFGGRVKTLHPRLLGGILFHRTKHKREAHERAIPPIDLVIVNLYPFAEKPTIENIDIGGVTLLRAAAKNYDAVTVVSDPDDYQHVIKEIKKKGNTSLQTRKTLAAKAFSLTASYDAKIARVLSTVAELRYGENPHQQGWFYQKKGWNLLQGKPLSYCNIIDADAAWSLASDVQKPTAVCIKHATPCGVASHKNISEAFQHAYDADPLSAFGVVIGLSRLCPPSIIQRIVDQKIFVEVIIAPGFERRALMLLKERPNIRAIKMQNVERTIQNVERNRSALGGMLVQTSNTHILTKKDLQCVTKKKPTPAELIDLLFAWYVVKHTLSNAIVFAKNQTTLGIGSGQTSRIDAVSIATLKAKRSGKELAGAVMASDAFFPFPDSVNAAADLGITAIIQPGGSKRDEEVIAEANARGIAMVFTGVRAFRH